MSSVIDRASAVAREILERRHPDGSQLRDNTFVAMMLAEAFAHGATWGLERGQHALAITHARYQTELNGEASPGGAS